MATTAATERAATAFLLISVGTAIGVAWPVGTDGWQSIGTLIATVCVTFGVHAVLPARFDRLGLAATALAGFVGFQALAGWHKHTVLRTRGEAFAHGAVLRWEYHGRSISWLVCTFEAGDQDYEVRLREPLEGHVYHAGDPIEIGYDPSDPNVCEIVGPDVAAR